MKDCRFKDTVCTYCLKKGHIQHVCPEEGLYTRVDITYNGYQDRVLRHGITEFELDTASRTTGAELLARMFHISIK